MADQSDVEIAICNALGHALFGDTSPPTALPLVGAPVEVFRGWPGSVKLDAILLASSPSAIVSVFTRNESERTTSRYPMKWQDAGGQAPALTAALSGNQITFGGACTPLPLNVAIGVPGAVYTYAVLPTDTPATVAAYFAGEIPGSSAAGQVLTCNTSTLSVTVGSFGPAVQEIRRQVKQFVVTIWTPSPVIRDTIANVIDPALATLLRLPMLDGTSAICRYAWSRSDDGLQRANCFRRDFAYNIEYATTNVQSFYDVTAPSAFNPNRSIAAVVVPPITPPTNDAVTSLSLDFGGGLGVGVIPFCNTSVVSVVSVASSPYMTLNLNDGLGIGLVI